MLEFVLSLEFVLLYKFNEKNRTKVGSLVGWNTCSCLTFAVLVSDNFWLYVSEDADF